MNNDPGLSRCPFALQVRLMQRVLVRLGHVDRDRVVQVKGRAATEMDACDELLVAEVHTYIHTYIYIYIYIYMCVCVCVCV